MQSKIGGELEFLKVKVLRPKDFLEIFTDSQRRQSE